MKRILTIPAVLMLNIIFFFTAAILSSCDPGISVAISNNTKADKRIEVHYPGPPYKDSHYTYDSILVYANNKKNSGWSAFAIPLLKNDTTTRVYTFMLKAGYTAYLEAPHLGTQPGYGKTIIINDADTVRLVRQGKDFKRHHLFLGGTWIYDIKDK